MCPAQPPLKSASKPHAATYSPQPARLHRNLDPAIPPDRPADAVLAHDAGYLPAERPLQHRAPGHQGELKRLLDQRELRVADLDRAAIASLYGLACASFREWKAKLPGERRCGPLKVPPLPLLFQVAWVAGVIALSLPQPLPDPPLLPRPPPNRKPGSASCRKRVC